jgi:hypothetical protein
MHVGETLNLLPDEQTVKWIVTSVHAHFIMARDSENRLPDTR